MTMFDELAATDLSLNMDLAGQSLIEASAGTGKTFTIAGLYARLVVEEGIEVRNILVMTFTKAATEELRTRLRERLQLAARWLDDPAADPTAALPADDLATEELITLALLRRTRAKLAQASGDAEAKARLGKRIDNAIQRMDEAAIFTIHGFCQRVLRDHAARIDGGGDDLDMVPSDRDLLQDIAADLWLEVAGSGDRDRLRALVVLAGDPDGLARRLADVVHFDGQLEPAPDGSLTGQTEMDGARQALVTAWQTGGDEAITTFHEWFDGHRLSKTKYKDDEAAQFVAAARALMAGENVSDGQLKLLSWQNLDKAINKKPREQYGDFPALPPLTAVDELFAMQLDLQALLLHELREAARERLAVRKRELLRRAYADLIATLRDAVTGPHAAALIADLRRQYPYAMVDEFQDTSPAQYAIFQALYDGFGSLLMIGDPKQAIYAFRGGDVHTYLAAAEGVARKRTLPRNFRSSSAMLAAIDALFTQVDDPFMAEGIAFTPVECGREPEGCLHIDGEQVLPLTLWQSDAGNVDEINAAMARGVACEIAGLLDPARAELNGKPVKPGDVAVLVNKHKEAELVMAALQAVNVPAVSVQKQSIYGTDEAMDVLRLLDALLAPQSLGLVRGALATVLLGRKLSDLQGADGTGGVADDDFASLAHWRRLWQRRGVLAMLEDVLEAQAARLLALDDGERRVANHMQLAEALQAMGHELAGPRALRDWLAEAIRDAGEPEEDDQLRLESDAERVQVMTLHASKGLEFELVFLPFMGHCSTHEIKVGQLAGFHRDGGRVKRLITRKDEADEEAIAQAEGEDLAERVRLLYVGITRAKRACWMGVTRAKGAKGIGVLQQVLAGVAGGAKLVADAPGRVRLVDVPTVPCGKPAHAEASTLGKAREFTRTLQCDWWVHSFSQLNRGARDVQVDAPADHDEEVPAEAAANDAPEVVSQPRGAGFGSAVHAILERADFEAWRDATEPPAAESRLIAEQLGRGGFVGKAQTDAAQATTQLLLASMNAPFIGDTRLVDIPRAQRCPEMRFHFGMAGAEPADALALLHEHGYQLGRGRFGGIHGKLRGLMHGIIDLVCKVDGQWWVIDYKTNHLGDRWADYDDAGMAAEVARAGYDLQYLIYSVAVHRWLKQLLGGAYDAERDFGGVRYLFLRGMSAAHPGLGVHCDRPPVALLAALDECLAAPGRAVA